MAVLLLFCLEYRDNPAQLGLVKLAAFLLQTLSAERAFGAALNQPLDSKISLPSKYAIPGTAADFLIQHLYTLIFSTKGALNAIYPAFILTITNFSPFLKNPSIRTSTRLGQLFLAMSTPTFLLSDEANPRLVYYILEAFNNVIQFQLSGELSASGDDAGRLLTLLPFGRLSEPDLFLDTVTCSFRRTSQLHGRQRGSVNPEGTRTAIRKV
jgi:hypothetical protein